MTCSRFRLSLAIIIIKLKPDDYSTEEYVKELSRMVTSCQDDLKELHKKIDMELNLDQPHHFSECDRGASTTPECQTMQILRSLPNKARGVSQKQLCENFQFLRMISMLKSLAVKSLFPSKDSYKSKWSMAVPKALELLKEALSKNDVSSTALMHMNLLVGKLIGDSMNSDLLNDDIFAHLVEVFDSCCITLLRSSSLNYSKSPILISLATSISTMPYVTERCLELTVGHIQSFGHHLYSAHNNISSLDLQLYRNSYYILDILDHILTSDIGQEIIRNNFNSYLDIKERLDESLLDITDEFPLYSYKIWSIYHHVQSLISEQS